MIQINRPSKLLNSFCLLCTKFSKVLSTQVEVMSESIKENVSQSEKRSMDEEADNEAKKLKTDTFVRIKRKNFAIMLGYNGKNYYGMQRNPGMVTIEEDLLKALLQAELITSDSFETIQNINFQRAARTDKGVSAVRQVVSLKLPDNPSKDIINKYLTEDIRVFAIKRVTKGFNSKSQCDARTYSYTIPTFAFADENMESYEETAIFHDSEKREQQLSAIDGKPYHEYRLPEGKKQELRDVLKLYEGTHKFHNFTAKVLPFDPKAKRYIMSFTAGEPFVIDNIEFITLKVKGQSFMLHQIRKMVSMAVGILRKIVTREIFNQAFEKMRFTISRAPSLGLMLNIVHYDYYNKRYGSDGMHDTLDWMECEEEITKFENDVILKNVFETELNEKTTLKWLAELGVGSIGIRDESEDTPKNEASSDCNVQQQDKSSDKSEDAPKDETVDDAKGKD